MVKKTYDEHIKNLGNYKIPPYKRIECWEYLRHTANEKRKEEKYPKTCDNFVTEKPEVKYELSEEEKRSNIKFFFGCIFFCIFFIAMCEASL